jgi:hypothetical protein
MLGSLTLSGSGSVTLGKVSKATPVSVMGDFVVNLPGDVPASASGAVSVPPGWNGDASPVAGEGWIFSVADGASLVINQP